MLLICRLLVAGFCMLIGDGGQFYPFGRYKKVIVVGAKDVVNG